MVTTIASSLVGLPFAESSLLSIGSSPTTLPYSPRMRCFHADLTKNNGQKTFKHKKKLNADIDEEPSVLELERWTYFVHDIPGFLEYESLDHAISEDDSAENGNSQILDHYMNPRLRAFLQDFENRGFAVGERLVQGNMIYEDRDICMLASLVKDDSVDPDEEAEVDQYRLKHCVTKIWVRLISDYKL
jgi:hypothetical protein